MPLSERVRIEVYLPDLPKSSYSDLLDAFDREFTYTFGGCTIVRGLDGSYLSQAGHKIQDRVNVIYTDIPLSLETGMARISGHVGPAASCSIRSAGGRSDTRGRVHCLSFHMTPANSQGFHLDLFYLQGFNFEL